MADDELIAFNDERAAELADLSLQQIRRLELQGLARPSVIRQLSARNTVRLYGFQDLESLLVVAALKRQRMTNNHIARVVGYLRDRGYSSPLTQIVFGVWNNEIYFGLPDGTWEGERKPDQLVIRQVIPLDEVRARIRKAAEGRRTRGDQGRVERRRKVLGSKPVFAGTRIPVASVIEYLRRGVEESEILEAFPRLTPRDIAQARQQLAS